MASYACCKYHFYRMLDNYLRVMKPGGQILTDQRGMDFTVEDKRWIFTFEDLQSLERKFSIRAARINDTVFALVSESAP